MFGEAAMIEVLPKVQDSIWDFAQCYLYVRRRNFRHNSHNPDAEMNVDDHNPHNTNPVNVLYA
jgi:hypothetical protein